MMLLNQIDNLFGQLMAFGEFHSLFYMADQDERTHVGLQSIVTVFPPLVFDEIFRFHHLADIVEIRTYTG